VAAAALLDRAAKANEHSPVTEANDQSPAAEANEQYPLRRGACLELPASGQLIMTGDLHDHALNLQRILHYAGLHRDPNRYLVLHEVVHEPGLLNGLDLSIRSLLRVAALKVAFPEQVLLLQSNHELAQARGERILKSGQNVIESFDAGLDFLFADEAETVREAFTRYVQSLPLAIRCGNGVMCCHSLPGPKHIDTFDKTVLDRVPTEADLATGGAVNRMVWGRHHNQPLADELAEAWGAGQFLMGHQPASMGHETEGETMLVLASNHEHGVLLPLDLSRGYTRSELIDALVPLSSIELGEEAG
jgi:hypothetical protein